ncbi:MAG TPA: ATP-binding protein, partial [Microbacterium sp.]|nr:ATP-binding protein [Microbacterium sp.]
GGDVAVPDWGASVTQTSNQDFRSIRNTVAAGDAAALATIATSDFPAMVQMEAEAQQPAYDQTISMATLRADDLRQGALLQTAITAVGAAIAVALSLIVALLISRRIVVPLRRLTTTATAVRAELPRLVERVAMPGESVDVAEVQIPVESRDEVGRLAEAFNGVNAATLSIAAEQAALRGSISEMFVNVARRDQVLLNRQLASIDDMERTQDDPETLTKLFALDHLATRMRRNSESLLVLAGIDTGRRLRRSMPLSDVIRTASSEIELYERVQLELDADPAMLGHSALTAAHLFAELLENATVFSDPGTPVVVRTSELDGQYIVEVQDSGIGMTEAELGEANSRVASTAASEILGAQRLGLFVVGRIARRIGARVSIESVEGQGTTARVVMTPSLFDSSVAPDMAHHSESTIDEAMHAPAALVANKTEDEQFEVPAAVPAESAYKPTVVESAPLVSREVADEPTVDELIAADAEAAPVGEPVDTGSLTDGVTGMGLPTRRRREAPIAVSDEEASKVIGLPARATAAQLSALEAATTDEEFKPAIPASEISPQTPEERAQMFRGFRSRRDLTDPAQALDPEAESLGHAARRGGLAPEDVVAAQQPEAMIIPSLEEDEFEVAPVAQEFVDSAEVPMLEADELTVDAGVPSLED